MLLNPFQWEKGKSYRVFFGHRNKSAQVYILCLRSRACNCKVTAGDMAKLSLPRELRKASLACRIIAFNNGNHTLTLCH